MGQPLMSKPMMKLRAEHWVNLVEQLDEISSANSSLVDFIEQALTKALRGDWKYQVLFDMAKFRRIYTIHQGIITEVATPHHIKRKWAFTHCIHLFEQWIIKNETPKHAEDIELNIHDIKNYLQEFLEEVQNINNKNTFQTLRLYEHQLLEYRYLFGSFFHRLHESHPEEKMLRQRFLFVDQYFETVETLLLERRNSSKRSK
jgi:hypothetical protein